MCNCKSGKAKPLNNLNSAEHLLIAKDVWDNIITPNDNREFTDLDVAMIYNAYNAIYPNASMIPTLEDAISKIQQSIGLLEIKYPLRYGKKKTN